jgi:hypothetical protein
VTRTPEQLAADAALTAAIQAVDVAYGGDPGDTLGDYLVITAWHRDRGPGETETAVMYASRDGAVPIYRLEGLIATLQRQWQAVAVTSHLTRDVE